MKGTRVSWRGVNSIKRGTVINSKEDGTLLVKIDGSDKCVVLPIGSWWII